MPQKISFSACGNAARFTSADHSFMRRALTLAANGAGHVSPNPMVGAVVVYNNQIIGEGWHHRYGEPHAEVNAIANVDVRDRHLLPESTIYVTLEPCSHYGKTPPCSVLLREKGLRRIVVATTDPFPAVNGSGIDMLREAGRQVDVGLLEHEARWLNRRFFTAHICHRPWIMLKWAQSADAKMGRYLSDGTPAPAEISSRLTLPLMHRQRAMCDAVLVGVTTMLTDHPRLTTRLWPGSDATPVTFDSHRLAGTKLPDNTILLDPDSTLEESLKKLYSAYGLTSLLVEGGPDTLQRFISSGLYDEIRVEKSPQPIDPDGIPAPALPSGCKLTSTEPIGSHLICHYTAPGSESIIMSH